MVPYVSVGVLVVILVLTGFFATVSRVSLVILHGLHAYLLSEDSDRTTPDPVAGNGAEKEGETNDKLKKKGGKKKRDRDVFDEAGAQILRIRLSEAQLESRKYFQEYDEAVIYSSLGLTSFVTREILQFIASSGLAKQLRWSESITPDDRITFMVGIFAVFKLLRLLAKVSYDPELPKKSERLLKWTAGIVGFVVASAVLILVPTSVLDFGINDAVADAKVSASLFMRKKGVEVAEEFAISTITLKLLLSAVAGVFSGLLFGPALRNVKSFWVATDQVEWNISVLERSRLVRPFLNLGIVLPLMVTMLWVKPMGEIFVYSGDVHEYKNLKETTCMGFSYGSGKLKLEGGDDSVCTARVGPQGCSSGQGHAEDEHKLEVEETGHIDMSGPGDSRGKDGRQLEYVDSGLDFLPKQTIQNVQDLEGQQTGVLSRVFMSRQYDWAAGFGVSENTFSRIQFWSLFLTGLLHISLLRVNIQTYCNGAVLVWYENLHRSKVHNAEVTKAKIFLNHYFVCRVALQSLVPGVLVLLMIGLARTKGSHLDNMMQEGSFFFAPSFVRAVMYFSSWWLVVMPALQSWAILALFRFGLLTSTA